MSYVTAGRYWSCVGCGCRYDLHYQATEVTCWKVSHGPATFEVSKLIECGLTGNEPVHFATVLNRYTDTEDVNDSKMFGTSNVSQRTAVLKSLREKHDTS